MPSVVLSREEATTPDLPMVCARCGGRALSFRRMPLCAWWLGPVQAPLCMEHHDHWRWRCVVVYLGLLVTVPAMIVGMMLLVEEVPPWQPGKALVFWAVATVL